MPKGVAKKAARKSSSRKARAKSKSKAPDWIQPTGKWTVSKGRLTQRDLSGSTQCYQNIGTSRFAVTFTMELLEAKDRIQAEGKFLFSDGNDKHQPFRIDFIYLAGLCRITCGGFQVGAYFQLRERYPHRVRIAANENFLSLHVDGMAVFKDFQFGKRSDGRIGFGTYNGSVRFSNIKIASAEKRCFVIMPYDQKRNFLYEYVIQPVLAQHPDFLFDFERADEILTVNPITEDITDAIDAADLIIADVTERNRNVFYELGYSHLRSRQAVLLIEREVRQKLDFPFDTQHFRHYEYEFSKKGFDDVQRRMTKALVRILKK